MEVDQALRTLVQLKGAAPPTTAQRLGDVIALLRQLDEENNALRQIDEQNAALYQQLIEENTTLHDQVLSTPPAAELMPQAFEVLRPALHIVRTQAEGLQAGKLGRVTTEQADCLRIVNDHTKSALRLIDSIDTVSLIQQGKLTIDQTLFSGLDVLAEAWQQHFQMAEQREHNINIQADDPLPQVIGDERQIMTILSDLMDNAIRYTPFGGVIRVRAESLGTHVLFSVADNGIGLSADDAEHISEPFWRARHQSLVRQHPGTGLSLYIARQILILHDSELLFSGEPSMGSTFSFMLRIG